jgi:hypothetical protein
LKCLHSLFIDEIKDKRINKIEERSNPTLFSNLNKESDLAAGIFLPGVLRRSRHESKEMCSDYRTVLEKETLLLVL